MKKLFTAAVIISSSVTFGQWTEINSTQNTILNNFDFIDQQTGYADSYNLLNGENEILKTSDGGLSWTTIIPPNQALEYFGFSAPY